MQVVEGGDGRREVALGMIQLLYVPCDLFDLSKDICCKTKLHNICYEKVCKQLEIYCRQMLQSMRCFSLTTAGFSCSGRSKLLSCCCAYVENLIFFFYLEEFVLFIKNVTNK